MTAQFFKPLGAVMATLALLSGPEAIAQEAETQTPASSGRSYEPAYFERFAPQNAFDMVRRVPGFQLRGGNNARGLGQGGANVLVNGQPITGKGGDPFDQVARVPAANVVKIEILEGTSLDIPGLTGQVVNVVTKSSEGISGSWEWNPEWRVRQEANLLRANVKVSGETGNLSYAGELRNNAFRNGDYGPEIRRNADGSIYELRSFKGRYNGDNPGASVNLTWKPKDDHIGNLNFEYNQFNFVRNSSYQRDAVGELFASPGPGENNGVDGFERFNFGEDEWNGKVDGDFEFPFWEGKLKLIGYYRQEDSPTLARFYDYDADSRPTAQTEFHQSANEGEAIGKTEYSWSPKDGRDWQVSLEGAYNFLDIENQFFDVLDPSNNSDPHLLEIDESRGEAFLTHTRKLNDKWSVQASVGAEYSELTAGGQTRTFTRPKGFVSTTYTKDDTFNVTAKVERQVGQLNFFDFSSSVSLQEDVGDRGTNLDLVPEQAWWGEVKLNKTFKDGHAIDIEAHGRIVEDIVDSIPLNIDELDATGNVIDTIYTTGIGNIGSGEQGGVHINATLKGKPFGFDGIEINTGIAWHGSNVTDPITGEDRQFSGQSLFNANVSFRHDIPKTDWAWGFYFDTFENGSNYSPFEISRFDMRPGWNELFIEHKDFLGMKVKAELGGVFEIHNQLDRRIFTSRRDLPGSTISRIENRKREYDGPYLQLVVSDTF